MTIIKSIIEGLPKKLPKTERVIIGLYSALVINTRGAGLSSTLYGNFLQEKGFRAHLGLEGAGKLHLRETDKLIELLYSDTIVEAAVGMAALNSCIPIDESRAVEVNAGTLIREKGKDKHIAIIGAFPFARGLADTAERLSVFELYPADNNELSAEKIPDILPGADVVAITGTAILNHTIDDIMKHVSPDAFTLLVGPSTPMMPHLLNAGFDALCGGQIIDPGAVEACVGQAVPFKNIQGIRQLIYLRE